MYRNAFQLFKRLAFGVLYDMLQLEKQEIKKVWKLVDRNILSAQDFIT